MISSDLSEMLLSYVLVDQYSPFIDTGFEVSLHHGGTSAGLTGELTDPSYQRGFIGCGPGFWTVGSRSAVNLVDVYFPMTAADEMWRSVRMAGVWSVGSRKFLFGLQFDESGLNVGLGDRLYIPEGGLVFGFV